MKIRHLFLSLVLLLSLGLRVEDEFQDRYQRIKQEIGQLLSDIDEAYSVSGEERLLYEKAKILLDLKEYKKALASLSACNTKTCKSLKAEALYRKGDYQAALDLLEELDIKGDNWQLALLYARVCEALNLYPEAVKVLKEVPGDAPVYEDARKELEAIQQARAVVSLEEIFPEEVLKDISSATSSRFPQAGSVLIREKIRTQVTRDNKMHQRVYILRKILNDRGKQEHGEIIIRYDSTYETVKLIKARTITPQGKLVSVGKKDIRTVSVYRNFPLYSNVKALIVSMPELAPGALVEYEFEITDNKLIDDRHFTYYISPQWDEPVIYYEDVLILPKGRNFAYQDWNMSYKDFEGDFSPDKTILQGGDVQYTWRFRDIPQVITEPYMPSMINVVPVRVISTFDSWDEIYRWWWKLARDKIRTSGEIDEKLEELLKGKSSPSERARAIYNYCASQIRYVAVEYGKAGYEPHYADEIFENKYGDCKDQSILLVSMLRKAGLEAYPVIIPTRDILNMRPDFPAVMFNHAIAVVRLKDQWVFMDPTAETCAFGDLPVSDQGRNVLLYTDKGLVIEKTPVFPVDKNLVSVSTDLSCKPGQILGNREVVAYGFFAQGQRYWLRYTMPEHIKNVLQDKARRIVSDAVVRQIEMEDVDTNAPSVRLRYSFQGSADIFVKAGDYRIFPLFEAISVSDVAKQERRYPLLKDGPFERRYRYVVKLGEIRPVFIPDDISVTNKWFDFSLKYRLDEKQGEIVEDVSLKNKVTVVSPKEYPEYRKAKERLSDLLKQRLLFKVVK